jgi:uncharacterized protein (DUF2164 family)
VTPVGKILGMAGTDGAQRALSKTARQLQSSQVYLKRESLDLSMETGNFRTFIISFFTSGELGEYAIVGGIDEAAAMLLDQRINQLAM